MHNADKF